MDVQLDLSHYYRQREGAPWLSPTLQSSEVWTPQQVPQRETVSEDRYEEYLVRSPASSRLPWGREREYGGIGPVSLPDDRRPKAEPPPLEEKGHKHYGYGGDPWPRGIPTQQYYELTQLKKSNLRASDDLYPKPPAASINARQLYLDFPAEHPYHSHISKFAVFPSFKSPEEDAQYASLLHPQRPARPYTSIVLRKSKGNPYRHEVLHTPTDSQKEPLIWPGQQGYFHRPKFHHESGQVYYPIPPKTVAPNALCREPEDMLSDRTVNLQRNVRMSQWITSYNRDFTDRGEINPLQLDNYENSHRKIRKTDENTELKPTFTSEILQASPLEGQIVCLRDGRRSLGVREEVLQENPEGHLVDNTKNVNSYEESDVALPNSPPRPSGISDHSFEVCAEQRPKCYSPSKIEPGFRKITDTEQFNVLYRRQLTPKHRSPEEEQRPPSIVCYGDLPPTWHNRCTVFRNPLNLIKPLIKSSPKSDVKESKTLKTNENDNILNLYNKQHILRMHDRQTNQPRTAFLQLQDTFSKSETCKEFHQHFPENSMDLRENYHSGRRHKFYGFHSYYFHN
ncbi:sperm-associated microtubule inner protein 4 [Pelodytes ibericus]